MAQQERKSPTRSFFHLFKCNFHRANPPNPSSWKDLLVGNWANRLSKTDGDERLLGMYKNWRVLRSKSRFLRNDGLSDMRPISDISYPRDKTYRKDRSHPSS